MSSFPPKVNRPTCIPRTLAACLLALWATGGVAAEPQPRYVLPATTDGHPAPPFSEGILIGGTFYVAGHVGLDAAAAPGATAVDAEAHAVLDAVKKTLAAAGLGMDDLVSVTVYCTDLNLYDAFNAVYRSYFRDKFPTRAFIGVNQLVRGARFEISGIAVAGQRPTRRP